MTSLYRASRLAGKVRDPMNDGFEPEVAWHVDIGTGVQEGANLNRASRLAGEEVGTEVVLGVACR